jgi:phosphinothricin acetyltransferase
LPNAASVALHERLGFRHAGTYGQVGFKLGRWWDVGLWQRALAAASDEPEEPLPLHAVTWPAEISRPG